MPTPPSNVSEFSVTRKDLGPKATAADLAAFAALVEREHPTATARVEDGVCIVMGDGDAEGLSFWITEAIAGVHGDWSNSP